MNVKEGRIAGPDVWFIQLQIRSRLQDFSILNSLAFRAAGSLAWRRELGVSARLEAYTQVSGIMLNPPAVYCWAVHHDKSKPQL
jgi:hypothetical protein